MDTERESFIINACRNIKGADLSYAFNFTEINGKMRWEDAIKYDLSNSQSAIRAMGASMIKDFYQDDIIRTFVVLGQRSHQPANDYFFLRVFIFNSVYDKVFYVCSSVYKRTMKNIDLEYCNN